MKEIKAKIAELLIVSIAPTYDRWNFKEIREKMKRQNQIIDELKVLAKAEKTLVGRIVQFPVADSYAMYVVTGVNPRTARLQWIDYCDGWMDNRCGKESNVDLKFVTEYVNHQDSVEEFFARKKNENLLNQE
jgi:hypothetical protein